MNTNTSEKNTLNSILGKYGIIKYYLLVKMLFGSIYNDERFIITTT